MTQGKLAGEVSDNHNELFHPKNRLQEFVGDNWFVTVCKNVRFSC